jgi:hypothetical protein
MCECGILNEAEYDVKNKSINTREAEGRQTEKNTKKK